MQTESPPNCGIPPSSMGSLKDFFDSYMSATRPLTTLPSAFSSSSPTSPESDSSPSSPTDKKIRKRRKSVNDDPPVALSRDELQSWKKRRRRKQNRIAAQNSRERKKTM